MNCKLTLGEKLKDLRNNIAMQKQLPPFMILQNLSLMYMAEQLPRTDEDFLKIHGIGRLKAKQYSAIFVDEIKRYLGE